MSQGLKGMARPIACTVNLGSNGGNLFTDVAGLLLRRPSGHSHIETWVVIRFKNFTPKTSHRIFEHMHGILNKLFTKLFTQIVCKSRDEFNEST